jgi:hypothetical protein
MTKTKRYSELKLLPTFQERLDYLKLKGSVGLDTFGFDRYLNQTFYRSPEWKRLRDEIIIRDEGCDLGVPGYEIFDRIYIHHMNPISQSDLMDRNPDIMNPEFLICVSHRTHNAIHYGTEDILPMEPIIRTRNDTCPWKHD